MKVELSGGIRDDAFLSATPTTGAARVNIGSALGEEVTEMTMRALFNTREQRDEVAEQCGSAERGPERLGRLAAYVESRRGR